MDSTQNLQFAHFKRTGLISKKEPLRKKNILRTRCNFAFDVDSVDGAGKQGIYVVSTTQLCYVSR